MNFCRIIPLVFALFYLVAIAILAIGTFGLFGQERDPLSAIYLIPLGLPWVHFIDVSPEWFLPWFGVFAPLLNLLLLTLLCKVARGNPPSANQSCKGCAKLQAPERDAEQEDDS